MITTNAKFNAVIEVGNRSCSYDARAILHWASEDRIELIEVDECDFTVHVYDEDVEHFKGEYSDMDAPAAEVAYWEERIKIDIKRTLAKRCPADWEWVDENGLPYTDRRDLLG